MTRGSDLTGGEGDEGDETELYVVLHGLAAREK